MQLFRLFLFLSALLLAATPLWAGERPENGISLSTSYVGEADVEDDEGKYSVFSATIAARYSFLSAEYKLSNYSWDDEDDLPFLTGTGNDAWDTLHSLWLGAQHGDHISGNWSYFVRGGVSSAFEEEMEDSFGAVALGGAAYDLGSGWEVQAGVGGKVHPVKNTLFPVLGVSWEGKSAGGQKRFFSLKYPKAEAGYGFSEEWLLRAAIGTEGDTYRLADDSDVSEEGYADISEWNAGLYVDWTPATNLMFTLGAEYRFAREITIYDDDGDELDEYDSDAAPAVTLSVGYSF